MAAWSASLGEDRRSSSSVSERAVVILLSSVSETRGAGEGAVQRRTASDPCCRRAWLFDCCCAAIGGAAFGRSGARDGGSFCGGRRKTCGARNISLHSVAWDGVQIGTIKAHVTGFAAFGRLGGQGRPLAAVAGGWSLVAGGCVCPFTGFGRDTTSAQCFAPCRFARLSKILRDRRLPRARLLGCHAGLHRLLHN